MSTDEFAREEQFASEEVAAALREHGVEIHTGVKVSAVDRAGDGGEVTLTVGEIPLGRLVHCVPAFPARSEIWSRCWMPGRVRLHATDLRESP